MSKWHNWSPFQMNADAKRIGLIPELQMLTRHHWENCRAYRAILNAYGVSPVQEFTMDSLPFIPVRLFKHLDLLSVDRTAVVKTLTSSGSSGQGVSKVFLDKETAAGQTRALVKTLQEFIGLERLPMLIIDHPGVIQDRNNLSARGAGILGLSNFGRDHTYALNDEDMSINYDTIIPFLDRHRGKPKLVFGFTFMVWKYFAKALHDQERNLDIENGILLHSGGWKRLESESVDNSTFKRALAENTRIQRVHNFYGMAEQVGSVFVECEEGVLHAPAFADIIVRRATDWQSLPEGQQGVIQVLSVLPRSYPGHSLLTEDLGVILGNDNCPCGRTGKTFQVNGRIQQAETRGCSDTHVEKNDRD